MSRYLNFGINILYTIKRWLKKRQKVYLLIFVELVAVDKVLKRNNQQKSLFYDISNSFPLAHFVLSFHLLWHFILCDIISFVTFYLLSHCVTFLRGMMADEIWDRLVQHFKLWQMVDYLLNATFAQMLRHSSYFRDISFPRYHHSTKYQNNLRFYNVPTEYGKSHELKLDQVNLACRTLDWSLSSWYET